MRILSRQVHGIVDYAMGLLLLSSPWLLGFAGAGPATTIPLILGGTMLVCSLLTNYEISLIHVVPFRLHLAIDFLAGAFLAASPWLFGFAGVISLPHVIFGLILIAAVLLTHETENYVHHSHHVHSH